MIRWLPLLLLPLMTACFGGQTVLTESEEYYAGRAVAANIISKFHLHEDQDLLEYTTDLGYSLVFVSDRPEIFNGYHFVIIESPEVNAFSGPGGFIFITTAVIRECRNEEEFAGVLAHELGHISLKHPEKEALAQKQKQEMASGLQWIGETAGKVLKSEELKNFAKDFSAIVDQLAEVAVKGYGRDQELEADEMGAELLARRGYNPRGLRDLLSRMRNTASGGWLSSTHPPTSERVARIDAHIASNKLGGVTEAARTSRFEAKTRRLRGR